MVGDDTAHYQYLDGTALPGTHGKCLLFFYRQGSKQTTTKKTDEARLLTLKFHRDWVSWRIFKQGCDGRIR